jgi:hypothetical protein
MAMRKSMDVEQLVTWAMLDQGLGWSMFGEQLNRPDASDYGTRIQSSGICAPNVSRLSDDDALIVRDVILMLPHDVADLVVRYGRIGDRPDWCEEGVGSLEQKRNNAGQLMWVWEKPGNRRSKREPLMEWKGWRPKQVEYFRATYRVWWHGLTAMVEVLNDRLDAHEATGPVASLEPWTDGARVIHTDDGRILTGRTRIANHGKREDFVFRNGRFERFNWDRHGNAFESGS